MGNLMDELLERMTTLEQLTLSNNEMLGYLFEERIIKKETEEKTNERKKSPRFDR